jgi:ElaB/YqjD/DUF883 family membrane-anchored ribosome-binding protein
MTKDNYDEVMEVIHFTKDHMAAKDDLEELRSELKRDIRDIRDELRSKIDGVHRRADEELDHRKQLEVRVGRLEETVL